MQANNMNISFERTILCSIVFDTNVLELCVKEGLRPEHLTSKFRQDVLKQCTELQGRHLDEEVIKHRLGVEFDETEMLYILSSNPMADVSYFVKEVVSLANIREARLIAMNVLEQTNSEIPLNDIIKTLNVGVESLTSESSNFLNIHNINEIEAKEAEFICKKWLPFPKRAVSLVSAGGGVGKSFLLMQAAMRIVEEDNLKVFMWLSEDPVELSKHRYDLISEKVMNANKSRYANKIHIAGSDTETKQFLEEERGKISISGMFYQFKKMLNEYDVIILDPLIAFFGADENNNTHARQFINLFTRWATVENKTIMFIHHGTKNSSQSRGASAFVDAVRLVHQVELVKNDSGEQIEDEYRQIILAKDNNGAKKHLTSQKFKRQVFPKKPAPVKIEFAL